MGTGFWGKNSGKLVLNRRLPFFVVYIDNFGASCFLCQLCMCSIPNCTGWITWMYKTSLGFLWPQQPVNNRLDLMFPVHSRGWQSITVWSKGERGRGTFHKRFMSWLYKSWKNTSSSFVKYNYPIKSQFCICHDSSAVVAYAKLWPDWVIKIKISEQK